MSESCIDQKFGRVAFGDDPGSYHATRPGYPDWVFETLRERCRLAPGTATFEIGAGTGTATRRLLDFGALPLLAIEPDPVVAGRTRAAAMLSPRSPAIVAHGAWSKCLLSCAPDGAQFAALARRPPLLRGFQHGGRRESHGRATEERNRAVADPRSVVALVSRDLRREVPASSRPPPQVPPGGMDTLAPRWTGTPGSTR